MPRFVYTNPILPGKSDLVKHVYAHKREHPDLDQETQKFNQLIGVTSWQAWLQHTPSRDFFLHGFECRSLEEMFNKLQDQIEAGHPRALWLRNFYLDITGKDYSHFTAMPDLEPLVSTELSLVNFQNAEIHSRAFSWPLRPNKVYEHREFCRQCAGEYRYRIQDALRQFGIIKSIRYLQKTPNQDYVVVYQEYFARTPEQEQELREAEQTNPSWQWLSSILTAHTGLDQGQLTPEVLQLTRQPVNILAAAVNPWRVPVASLI